MNTHLTKAFFLLTLLSQNTVGADDTLSDYLWSETEELRRNAIDSLFIQGLKNVSLDPSDFGGYMVQDTAYMYLSKQYIDIAANRTSDLDLKQFLEQTSKSYESLYIEMCKKWHIEDTKGIKLGDACTNYVNHLNEVANSMEPIYIVAAIIPCVKLWPWVGEQIGADLGNFGVYTKWIQESFDPTYKGYKLYELMVDNAYKEGTIDKNQALQVYQKSMKGEVDFFNFL